MRTAFSLQNSPGLGSVARDFDVVAPMRQHGLEYAPKDRIIVCNQDPHNKTSRTSARRRLARSTAAGPQRNGRDPELKLMTICKNW